MNDSIRRFLIRLSLGARKLFFDHLGVTLPDVSDKKPRERDKKLVESLMLAKDSIRGAAEAISTHVLLLSNKGDFAERALRSVCEQRIDLIDILESEKSLEERIFIVWLEDELLLDRARNVAMSFHQRHGRFHCAFKIKGDKTLGQNLAPTIREIQSIVQNQQGGRNVSVDSFTYLDEKTTELVHHFAIYLETPASWVMTFEDSENKPIPILRRDAKELAIDYNPKTGNLDLAGKGIGGQQNLEQIANAFANSAITGSELQKVTYEEWKLDDFLYKQPSELTPPSDFSEVYVSQMVLYSQKMNGGKVTIKAGKGEDVYKRMHSLGISEQNRLFEEIYSLTLTLQALLNSPNDRERFIRVTISGKNARLFDGTTLNDRKVIEQWLAGPPFIVSHDVQDIK